MHPETLEQPLLKLLDIEPQDLADGNRKVAVVKDAGSQIGQTLARHCAERACDLLLIGGEAVGALAEDCRTLGAKVEVIEFGEGNSTGMPDKRPSAAAGSAAFLSGSLRDSMRGYNPGS
jgi:NAD(P)-dependent dehydrogenase (short-subunit alcohol dehydrogenase family)